MPRDMLDTDPCSYIMKRSHSVVLKRLQAVPVADVCMSVVTKAELLYGVEVSPRRAQDDAAIHYAEIRAHLKRRGAMIGANQGATSNLSTNAFPETPYDSVSFPRRNRSKPCP
jgi:tRNA(fMet)-specific endonuclease VapC